MNESRVQELADQINGVRNDFGRLLTELEQRGREATDVKLQARRHPGAAAGMAALLVGVVVYLVRRRLQYRRELRDPLARRRRVRQGLDTLAHSPDSHQRELEILNGTSRVKWMH